MKPPPLFIGGGWLYCTAGQGLHQPLVVYSHIVLSQSSALASPAAPGQREYWAESLGSKSRGGVRQGTLTQGHREYDTGAQGHRPQGY